MSLIHPAPIQVRQFYRYWWRSMIGHADGSVLNDDSERPGRGSRTGLVHKWSGPAAPRPRPWPSDAPPAGPGELGRDQARVLEEIPNTRRPRPRYHFPAGPLRRSQTPGVLVAAQTDGRARTPARSPRSLKASGQEHRSRLSRRLSLSHWKAAGVQGYRGVRGDIHTHTHTHTRDFTGARVDHASAEGRRVTRGKRPIELRAYVFGGKRRSSGRDERRPKEKGKAGAATRAEPQ